jgi:hypothetical protein
MPINLTRKYQPVKNMLLMATYGHLFTQVRRVIQKAKIIVSNCGIISQFQRPFFFFTDLKI